MPLIFDKKFPNNTTRHFEVDIEKYRIRGSVTIVNANLAMIAFSVSDNRDKFNTCFCEKKVYEITLDDIRERVLYCYPERFM